MEPSPDVDVAGDAPVGRPAPDHLIPATRSSTPSVLLDSMIGLTSIGLAVSSSTVDAAVKLLTPVGRRLPRPSFIRSSWTPQALVTGLAERGRRVRSAAGVELDQASRLLVPAVTDAVVARVDLTSIVVNRVDLVRIVEAVLDRIDLTELVLQRVDLDRIVGTVDLDAVASRIDVDAVAARLDLVGIADYVIEAVDLPEIIRGSTGSVATEVVRGARMQSIEADKQLQHVVDRLLLRRRARKTDAPGEVDTSTEEES